MTDLTYERVVALLLAHPWRYAKSMPDQPHWYTLRREWEDDDAAFTAVVRFIRRHGYDEVYKRARYRMLDVGEMKYWTMFASPERTTLINRTYIDDQVRFHGLDPATGERLP